MDRSQFPGYRIVPLADLIPNARNARTHSAAQIEKLAASMREFGFTAPVLTDGANGILAGHGRVLAAEAIGLDEAPTIELAHLTDAQRRAYLLADNRLALDSGWDEAMLASELRELADFGFDLGLTGFGSVELDQILAEPIDPAGEWRGMPDFEHEDKEAFRTLRIHFADQAAVDRFAKLLKQTVTDKTKFLWYPAPKIERYADKNYVSEQP